MGVRDTITSAIDSARTTVSEKLSPSAQFKNFRSGISTLRHGSEFINDIFNDEQMDPHAEMRQTFRMMYDDIRVRRTAQLKALLILGRDITVETSDDATKEFFDNTVIPKLRQPLETAAIHAVGIGNGHIEVARGEQTGVPKDFKQLTRPHKMYNRYESDDWTVTGYVAEALRKNYRDDDRYETVTVPAGEQRSKQVTGTLYDEKNIIHLTTGTSVLPGYGRSTWASGIDDYKMKREFMRAQALIARHKSMPRKAFVFNDQSDNPGISDPGATAPQDQQQQRERKLSNMEPDENPVFQNVELDIMDYSYTPKQTENDATIDQLGKNLTSPVPSFVSEPGETNRATAAEERPVIQMEFASIRQSWEAEINPVLQEIAAANGYDADVSIRFGDFDFPTREQKIQETLKLWNDGLLTMQQVADRLPIEFEPAEDVRDAYEFELDRNQDPFAGLQQKLDDVTSVDPEEIDEALDR